MRSVDDGPLTWGEWHWSGTRTDGQPFEARGVIVFEIADSLIAAGWLYLEDVERATVGVEAAVEKLSGQRPHTE